MSYANYDDIVDQLQAAGLLLESVKSAKGGISVGALVVDSNLPVRCKTECDASEKRGTLRLVASPDGANGSVTIQQNARMYAGLFDGDESVTHTLAPGRLAYVHVARGAVTVNGVALNEGDAAKIENEASVRIDKGSQAEVLLFDLPPLQ